MESIWENISTALELAPDTADRWLAKLRAQYAQSHRHYHTESELIRRKVPHLKGASVCIQLAALFQYYHFEADKDCVARNCETVGEFFADAQIENKTLEANVKRLLGDLQMEAGDLSENDVQYFQDLDLLVLGIPAEEYKQYTQQLRNECPAEDVSSYDKMRLKLLQALSRIPSIYMTAQFSERFESAARTNIEQEIKDLQSK
ncbi:uncharacterized protein LOC120904536 isoform X2 [Anopheles arabiensis]|uniref:Uncharacterized protein n=1 Tax=Anopheles arabiensis TaxID=7173 RepID=A0A182I3L3_ANOAR|nr:uncharacterized protein LOC120904536 isoform X2 [Anopheles arabiensis]